MEIISSEGGTVQDKGRRTGKEASVLREMLEIDAY